MNRALESLLVGRVLVGRYEIEEVIGRGGMSIVYRALDRRLERPVAVKVVSLPAEGESDRAHLRERLRREAASAARIPPHPNVVQVYDHGADPELDLDFIVMELLRGRDLKAALRAGGLSRGESLRVLREAARGLAAGHRAGIVHRDVKPANIFLTGERDIEAVRILDFGIAKALEPAADEDLTRTGQVPHSPAYASPEQLRGETALTPASDVYQLGLVGSELLTGDLPAPMRRLLARALQPAPEDRFPDAAAFAEALADAEGGDRTLLAPEPSRAPPSPSPTPRRPATRAPRRAAQAAGVAALVLGAVWLLGRGGGESPASTGAPVEAGAGAAVDFAALTEEFRDLQRDAVENLREAASDEQGAEAAADVQRVIADLNQSWVRGEMERHLSHYAERVDFYTADDAPRSRIREERERDLALYPEREIVIERMAVTFPEPGRALALVDKRWDFHDGEDGRRGEGRQELVLELRDGRWRVVSERMLEVY